MKIKAFKMIAFGPFAGKELNFSETENGLHMVYGDNEAGKSTSLRALIALLYGFEHRVRDDWLHATNTLAVGGELALDSGETIRFTRFKRRKSDLIDEDTGEAFDQSRLNYYLAGMSKEDFKNAYGISHEALRRGVESVLASGGELGQTLFTAASGLNVLKDVLSGLEEKQSKLFTPRAQKASINAGIALLTEQRRKIREVATVHTQWKKISRELELLEDHKNRIEARLSELNTTIGIHTRYREALKIVSGLQQAEQELKALAEIPQLPEDFPQRRIQAQAAISESRQARDNLQDEINSITAQIEKISFDEKIIAGQELIESLAGEIQVHIKEASDSKTLQARIHQCNRDAEAGLKLLRQGLSLEALESLRLSKPAENTLRRLGSRYARLEQASDTADEELKGVDAQLESVRDQMTQIGQPADTGELQGCLERVSGLGNLEARLAEARSEAHLRHSRINKELDALGLWQGDMDAFEKLALPAEESMRRYAGRFEQLRLDLADLENQIQRNRKDVQAKRREYEEVTRNRELPDPGDLEATRELRDQGWRSVRSVWLRGAEPDHAFLSRFPEQSSLADAYEKSVRKADDMADILHTESQAIAVARTLQSQIAELEQARENTAQRRDEILEQQVQAVTRWQALWRPLGINALSPAEMIEWSGRANQIRRAAADYHEKAAKQVQLEMSLEKINADLRAAFNRLGIKVPKDISHAALVDLARRTIGVNETLARQRQELQLRIKDFGDRKNQILKQIEGINEARQVWSTQWEAAMLPLKLPGATKPEEAMDYIDALEAVFVKLDEGKAARQRIDAMERNRKAFQEKVQRASDRLAPQLNSLEPEKAAGVLKDILKDNLQRRQQFLLLETNLQKTRARLNREKEKMAGNEEVLRQLCAEASTSDPERLPEVERQSRQKRQVLDHAAATKERLAELAAGRPLPAFVQTVAGLDPDVTAAELEKAAMEKADLIKEREDLVAGIAVAQNELKRYDGQSRAAGLAVEAEGLVGRIQTDVTYYIKLRLASVVLARAIERYRKHNESPVLEAAGAYFQTLTSGSFAGLKADFNDRGDPVLKAVRASDNSALAIDALSDGTRDQMFLALRLGGLSRHVENGGSVPFIVDDVLVHFDNERSAAALQAMAGLAEKTQIIFFTHHAHLLDLARKAVPSGLLATYRL